jgi:hypothetical protein
MTEDQLNLLVVVPFNQLEQAFPGYSLDDLRKLRKRRQSTLHEREYRKRNYTGDSDGIVCKDFARFEKDAIHGSRALREAIEWAGLRP